MRYGEWDDRVDDVSNKRRKKCGRLDAGSYRIRTISQIDKRTLDNTGMKPKWKPFLQSSRLFCDIILSFVSFSREANSYPNGIGQTKNYLIHIVDISPFLDEHRAHLFTTCSIQARMELFHRIPCMIIISITRKMAWSLLVLRQFLFLLLDWNSRSINYFVDPRTSSFEAWKLHTIKKTKLQFIFKMNTHHEQRTNAVALQMIITFMALISTPFWMSALYGFLAFQRIRSGRLNL